MQIWWPSPRGSRVRQRSVRDRLRAGSHGRRHTGGEVRSVYSPATTVSWESAGRDPPRYVEATARTRRRVAGDASRRRPPAAARGGRRHPAGVGHGPGRARPRSSGAGGRVERSSNGSIRTARSRPTWPRSWSRRARRASPRAWSSTFGGLQASSRAVSDAIGVRAGGGDRWLCCLPLHHVGGLAVLARSWTVGTPVDVLPRFDVEAVAVAAGRRSCRWCRSWPAGCWPPASTWAGSAGCSSGAGRWRPTSRARATYGLTETWGGVVHAGHPLDGVDVALGHEDEILVRGRW